MPEEKLNPRLLAKYTSNPMPANPIMDAEQSRFDAEAGFSINPNPNYFSENIDVLNESRAQAQSTLGRLGLFIPRVANKFLAEVASVPGYLYGAAEAAFTDKTIGQALDESYIKNVEEFSQELNEDLFKVYVPESVKNGGLISNLTSASFWAVEGADGVGFLTSMVVPGNALKLLKIGKGLSEGLNFVAKAGKTTSELSKFGNKAQKAALWLGKNYDDIQAAGVNTILESAAEGKESFNTALSEQINSYIKANNLSSEEEIPASVMQEFRNKAGEISSDVFKGNMSLLFASNLIDQANLFGAFGTKKSLASKIFDNGKLKPRAEVLNELKTGYKDILKAAGSGIIKEGFIEEGSQFAMSEFYKSEGLGEDKYDSIIEAYIDNLDDVDMQKAIALGGILGGGMSIAGEVFENKRTKEAIFGSDGTSRNKFQKLLGLKDKEQSFGLYDMFDINISERKNSILDAAERDADGKIIFENGEVKFNEEKLKKAYENLHRKYGVATMMNIASSFKKQSQYELLKGFFNFDYFLTWYQQGKEGVKLLKDHIKQELAPAEAKKSEVEEGMGIGSKKDIAAIEKELLDQADAFYEIYSFNVERHSLNFPEVTGGTSNDAKEFSTEVSNKKTLLSLNENIVTKQLKELGQELLSNPQETEEQKLKYKETQSKIEDLTKTKELIAENYKELFSKKSLQEKYNKFLEVKAKRAEEDSKKAEVDPLGPNPREEDIDNEYLRRLAESGYDIENNVNSEKFPIYYTLNGKGYVAFAKPGETQRTIYDSQTGQALGVFNRKFYKDNRLKIKFINKEDAEKAKRKRKLRERKFNQINSLARIATETKALYNTTLQEIEDKNFEVMLLLEELEQQQKSLSEVVDKSGKAKKGKKFEKAALVKTIESLENKIKLVQEQIDSLEKAKTNLEDKLQVVEEYKNNIESLTEEESFSFISELSMLEGKETTMEAELVTTSTIIEQIKKVLLQTDNEITSLKEKQQSLENLLAVYKDIQSVSEVNQLLLLANTKDEAYKSLIEKYPFLQKYKVRQYGLLQKIIGKVKW
jgi:hypothetical protein